MPAPVWLFLAITFLLILTISLHSAAFSQNNRQYDIAGLTFQVVALIVCLYALVLQAMNASGAGLYEYYGMDRSALV